MDVRLDSDSEVDRYGNLRDFIVSDGEICSSDMEWEEVPRRSGRLKRKRTEKPPAARKRARLSELFMQSKIFWKVSSKKEIIGRDEETTRILSMVLQPRGGIRPLLVGPAGIGILSIVQKTAQILKSTLKNHDLGNCEIYCLDCMELLADSVENEITEVVGEKLREIFEGAVIQSQRVPIFYLRHIEKILHLDKVTEYLQSVLKKPFPFIASISFEAKSETVVKAQKILAKYNFVPFAVNEPPIDDVHTIAIDFLGKNRLHQSISFTEAAVRLGVRLAAKYEHSRPFPVKAINLIQECANNVLLQRMMSGMEIDEITITCDDMTQVVSSKTKVPAPDLLEDSVFNQARFKEKLKSRVVGQDHAINIVSDRVAAYKMGLVDTKKPWGIFLFVGPTGVGKTELAKSLAKFLFNDESKLITINGSEYIEDHTVSNLIGSPKGYEGNESGGLLTEPLKKDPHQVVLLDEFEKAHPNVQKLFLQVFDGAPLIDRKGDRVDCSEALFIMTSNVGSQALSEAASRGGMSPESVAEMLVPLLKKEFSPELVGRFKRGIVPFQPLNKDIMPEVAKVKLRSIKNRLQNIDFTWTDDLVNFFAGAEVDLGLGMRDFCNMIDETVINLIKDAMLQSKQRISGKLELTYLCDKEQFGMSVKKN